MITDVDAARQYREAREAIRDAKNPKAYLNLGILYAQGIGTRENHVLANYFYEKAFLMGCLEAGAYMEQEYATGRKSVVEKVVNMLAQTENLSQESLAWLKKLVEQERRRRNYGTLSTLREHLSMIYPDYNQEKGFDDHLNDRKTVDADICYSLCTSENSAETNIALLDKMLRQLFAPISQNHDLFFDILHDDSQYLLQDNEKEICQCLPHLTASYSSICDKHGIKKLKIPFIAGEDLYPNLRVKLIPILRRQAFRCLLSLRGVSPRVNEFLGCLESSEQLLNVCETVEDEDLQLFLISFVELNIDIESLLLDYQGLLQSYRNHDLKPLIRLFNNFCQKLSSRAVFSFYPVQEYSADNPPQIDLSDL